MGFRGVFPLSDSGRQPHRTSFCVPLYPGSGLFRIGMASLIDELEFRQSASVIIPTNWCIGYRLRTASMETPHVTTVGAAISRPKWLNHCAFPEKRGALEAVRFRAADMHPADGSVKQLRCLCILRPGGMQARLWRAQTHKLFH